MALLQTIMASVERPSTIPQGACLNAWQTLLYLSEYGIESLALVCSGLFLIMLANARTIHPHLRIVTAGSCIGFMLRSLLRFVLIVHYVRCNAVLSTGSQAVVTFLFSTLNVSLHFSVIAVIAERLLSLFRARSYEYFFDWRLVTFLLLAPLMAATVLSVFVLYLRTVPLMVANYSIYCCLALSWTTFFVTFQCKQKRNRVACGNSTLSERFQRYENVQTKPTMIWLCALSAILIVIGGAFQVFRGMWLARSSRDTLITVIAVTECVQNCIHSFNGFVMPLTFLFTLQSMKQKFRRLFPSLSCHVPMFTKDGYQVVHSITGKILTSRTTTDEYFHSLTAFFEDKRHLKKR